MAYKEFSENVKMGQQSTQNPGPPMSRWKPFPPTHRLGRGLTSPIQAVSTPLHYSASR